MAKKGQCCFIKQLEAKLLKVWQKRVIFNQKHLASQSEIKQEIRFIRDILHSYDAIFGMLQKIWHAYTLSQISDLKKAMSLVANTKQLGEGWIILYTKRKHNLVPCHPSTQISPSFLQLHEKSDRKNSQIIQAPRQNILSLTIIGVKEEAKANCVSLFKYPEAS
jgi:hypothetical protein